MSTHRERLLDIAERIGIEFGKSTASRARDMAELFVSDMGIDVSSDEAYEDLVSVVAEGCGVFLRQQHSRTRANSTKSMVKKATAHVVGSDDESSQQSMLPVDFPITVRGEKTVPIARATCLDVQAFIDFVDAQQRGLERTKAFCENILPLWSGHDETLSLEELVAFGIVSSDDVARIADESRQAG